MTFFFFSFKICCEGLGRLIAQQLRALSAFPGVLGSFLSVFNSRVFSVPLWLCGNRRACGTQICMQAKHLCT